MPPRKKGKGRAGKRKKKQDAQEQNQGGLPSIEEKLTLFQKTEKGRDNYNTSFESLLQMWDQVFHTNEKKEEKVAASSPPNNPQESEEKRMAL